MKKTLLYIITVVILAAALCLTAACNPTKCTNHVDANGDGKCDVCGETMSKEPCKEHVDTDGDGKCDVCGETISQQPCQEHVDANGDGKCDVCGETISQQPCQEHVDANGDGKCDVCGESIYSEDGLFAGKTVSKIEISSEPTTTFYEIGDTFSIDGGAIKVIYTDGSEQTLAMSAACFTVSAPGMKASGTKTVTVKCGTKKCSFVIKVANKSYSVSYNLNFEGAPEAEVVKIVKGDMVEDKTPVREGYTFLGWYVNKDFTHTYDFSVAISEDADLYALWLKSGVQSVDVTFDHDYYGQLYTNYSYPVEYGTTVAMPTTPVRVGYTFAKWIDKNGNEFDFTTALTVDTTIKASWTKAVSGVQHYVFEAEDTDLTGKVGPAFSGTCQETAMIVPAPENRNCSNGRFVSYLYREGNSLEFYIACDQDVSDVTLYATLSAELRDYVFDSSNYLIEVNGVSIDYTPIVLQNVPVPDDAASSLDCLPFADFLIGKNLSLKKGVNVIRLITNNSVGMAGSTLEAAAPIVDCIKIETTAVLSWDANFGLPFADNY